MCDCKSEWDNEESEWDGTYNSSKIWSNLVIDRGSIFFVFQEKESGKWFCLENEGWVRTRCKTKKWEIELHGPGLGSHIYDLEPVFWWDCLIYTPGDCYRVWEKSSLSMQFLRKKQFEEFIKDKEIEAKN